MKLSILEVENEKQWRSSALVCLEQFKTFSHDKCPITVFANLTKGKYLRSLSECLESKLNDCFLFLVARTSFVIGEYLDADFALLRYDTTMISEERKDESFNPEEGVGKQKELLEKVQILTEENNELRAQIQDHIKNAESQEKIVRDKEKLSK